MTQMFVYMFRAVMGVDKIRGIYKALSRGLRAHTERTTFVFRMNRTRNTFCLVFIFE